MTAYSVGPGLTKRLAQYADQAASDETFMKNRDGRTQWSECFGKSGRRYVHLPDTNQVLVFDWDSAIVAGGGPDPSPPPTTPPIKQVRSPNFWATREGHAPIALVIHTIDGTLAGADAWFANPASQVSAHYGTGLDGSIHQYVPLEGAAWANGVLEAGNTWPGPAGVSPNLLTVSVETEDLKNPAQPVTEAQYASTLACGRLALVKYPSVRYLLRHGTISPRSRANCPGNRWVGSGAFARLALALGLEAR